MIIKDPIYGEINIEHNIIVKLIHTIEFQRLRKIKQLGIADLVFPGAEHTRFSHSIGVYHIINKFIKKFKEENKIFFTKDEEMAILVAGLLHDLGHGPLSHTAENFFEYFHEEYTVNIIINPETEIYKILKSEENIEDLIFQVRSFIEKSHPNSALNSLITSSLDADRMDYLLRDSYYTGAVYGTIDIDRIISQIDYEDKKIIFSNKSIHTLEDFILSRYHMFVQVYLSEKSLVYEGLLQKILDRVFILYSNNFEYKNDISLFLDLTQTEISISEYLKINDYNFLTLISSLKEENDEILRKMVLAFEKQSSYVKIDEEEFKTFDFYDVVKVDSYTKKVYNIEEPIYVKDEEDKIVTIDNVSPIFQISKGILEIKIQKNVFRINYEN